MHARTLHLIPSPPAPATPPLRRLPSRRTLVVMTCATVLALGYAAYDETTSRAAAPPGAEVPAGSGSITLVSAGSGR